MNIRQSIDKVLARANLKLLKNTSFEYLLSRAKEASKLEIDVQFLATFYGHDPELVLRCLKESKSQIRQDLFALLRSGFKRNGYFVEFGAASGCEGSNTYLLEKEFGWSGILAEPAKCWHAQLRGARQCHIETMCVWKSSGQQIEFTEMGEGYLSGVTSNLESIADNQPSTGKYEVPTISLLDLLRKYDAPRTIDYISMDTEGSEFDILNAFDFEQFKIKLITCEHNDTPAKHKIRALLEGKGYRRVPTPWAFEDWFVLEC